MPRVSETLPHLSKRFPNHSIVPYAILSKRAMQDRKTSRLRITDSKPKSGFRAVRLYAPLPIRLGIRTFKKNEVKITARQLQPRFLREQYLSNAQRSVDFILFDFSHNTVQALKILQLHRIGPDNLWDITYISYKRV